MQKLLIFAGLALILIGLAWPWLQQLPLGRLPGDIVVKRENFRFYFPLTSMILLNLILALIVWLYRQ